MAVRKLRFFGDNLLRKVAKPVKEIDGKLLTLLDDMRDTLTELNGAGLAAPQVGILKRVAIIDIVKKEQDMTGDTTKYGFYELINPEIVETEGEVELSEACLSLPGKSAPVMRPERVKVRALDRNGNEIFVEGSGVLAQAICHEVDHLDGILYVDKVIGDLSDYDDDEDDYEYEDY